MNEAEPRPQNQGAAEAMQNPERQRDANQGDDSSHSNDDPGRNDNSNEQQQQSQAPKPLGPYDAGRMELTHEETTWALRIKTAVEETPDLDNLNDFWYGALALLEEDDVEGALYRVRELQEIRKEYKIIETYAAARRNFHESFEIFSGQFLSFTFNSDDGNYIVAFDMSKQPPPKAFSSLDDMHLKLREIYYLCHICSPDFEAIRRGCTVLIECENVDMTVGTGNLPMFRKQWHIMLNYPFKVQKLKYFHMGLFANLMVSGLKRFLPMEIRSKFEVGCVSEGGTLDSLFLQPNLEAANQRILRRFEDTLQRRYFNEATFRL